MSFIHLPAEIHYLVHDHLDYLEDLCALVSSCRKFYRLFSSSKIALRPMMTRPQGHTVLAWHYASLLPAIQGQLIDWAMASEQNGQELRSVLHRYGTNVHRVFVLANEVARINLEQIRRIYDADTFAVYFFDTDPPTNNEILTTDPTPIPHMVLTKTVHYSPDKVEGFHHNHVINLDFYRFVSRTFKQPRNEIPARLALPFTRDTYEQVIMRTVSSLLRRRQESNANRG